MAPASKSTRQGKVDIWVDVSKVKLADGRLELCQLSRLLQLIRERHFDAIANLVAKGVPSILDHVHPNGDGETALGLAASVNDNEMLEHLVSLGADPNVYDLRGRSAAMRAADLGHVQSMNALAKAGIDMTIVDETGQGVLFYCIGPTKRHAQCGEIALQHGADVENKTRQGTPILMFACETAKDNEDFCMALLQSGANPLTVDKESNRTPVIAAASSGSARVIRALLNVANNVNEVMNPTKVHALHEAAKNGHFEAIKMMAGFGANFNLCTDRGYSTAETPIHMAAANGKDDCIVFLASRGCNALAKNKENKTARMIAKELGVKSVIKACRKAEKMSKTKKKPPMWLIRLHDFCFIRDAELTAAFQEIDSENQRIVDSADFERILNKAGAPMPENPADWKTLLTDHIGERKNTVRYNMFLGGRKLLPKKYLMSSFEPKFKRPKKAKKIKVKGWPMPICTLPPDLVDPDTIVPRHLDATDVGRFDRDHPPEHPLEEDSVWYMTQPTRTSVRFDIALWQLDSNTVRDATYVPTLTAGGIVYVPVHPPPVPDQLAVGAGAALPPLPVAAGTPPSVVWQVPVLGDKAQVNLRDSTYKTPLVTACAMGNLELVRMMVEAGADVNARDNFRWTPLHHAAHAGVKSVVEYLLMHGARLEAPAINGTTPLYRAVESNCAEIVQYLIDSGAKVRVENRCEMTPLDVAACYADYEVWNIIKKKEDSLPPVKDKKKKKKKPRRRGNEAPPLPKPPRPLRPVDLIQPLHIRDIPDAGVAPHQLMSTSLRSDNDTVEDITHLPEHVWTKLMTSEELVAERQERRRQRGWQVDFENYQTPFQQNITNRLNRIKLEEDAAAEYKKKTAKRK